MNDVERFAEGIKENVKDHLPDDYRDAKVEVRDNHKLNESYVSLTVTKEDQAIAPSINLSQLYKEYQKTGDMDKVFDEISKLVEMQPGNIDISVVTDYDRAKENLFIRISNAEANKGLLENAPHDRVGDLAVTYHLMMTRDGEGMGSTMITNDMMNSLGVSADQLKADALENSPKILPATLEPMTNIMSRLMGMDESAGRQERFIENALDDFSFKNESMYVLSNAESINGAAAMIYPDVLEQIGEASGENFFILPSSVHEVLIVADDGVLKTADLEKMVQDINRTEVEPKDRLSDTVYHYDSNEHRLERAVDFEERKDIEKTIGRNVEKLSIKDKLKDAEVKVNEQLAKARPAPAQAIE